MTLSGGCHCGNLRLALDWPAAAPIPSRECCCDFCRKHGARWTSHPAARLTLTIGDRSRLLAYAFGTRTAEFLVCARCGVLVAALSRIEGRTHAVVALRALADLDPARVQAAVHADFDGETEAARLARRARNWIGAVEVVG